MYSFIATVFLNLKMKKKTNVSGHRPTQINSTYIRSKTCDQGRYFNWLLPKKKKKIFQLAKSSVSDTNLGQELSLSSILLISEVQLVTKVDISIGKPSAYFFLHIAVMTAMAIQTNSTSQ